MPGGLAHGGHPFSPNLLDQVFGSPMWDQVVPGGMETSAWGETTRRSNPDSWEVEACPVQGKTHAWTSGRGPADTEQGDAYASPRSLKAREVRPVWGKLVRGRAEVRRVT